MCYVTAEKFISSRYKHVYQENWSAIRPSYVGRRHDWHGGAHPPLRRQQMKFSSGSNSPRIRVPPGATDCHHHIYDARYPAAENATLRPADALIADYRALQARIGTTRNVIVQPSAYGVDNRLLVESLAAF